MVQYKIGIDIGSTTAKVVVLRAGDGGLVFQRYERHQAKVRECLAGFFSAIAGVVGNEPVEVNITGSVPPVLWEHLPGHPVFSKENVLRAVWEETELKC